MTYEYQALRLPFKKALLALGYSKQCLDKLIINKTCFYNTWPFLDYRGRCYIPFFSSTPVELRPLIFLPRRKIVKNGITKPQLFAILQTFYEKPLLDFSRYRFISLKRA